MISDDFFPLSELFKGACAPNEARKGVPPSTGRASSDARPLSEARPMTALDAFVASLMTAIEEREREHNRALGDETARAIIRRAARLMPGVYARGNVRRPCMTMADIRARYVAGAR